MTSQVPRGLAISPDRPEAVLPRQEYLTPQDKHSPSPDLQSASGYLLGCDATGNGLLHTLPGHLCHHHVGESIEHLGEESNESDLQLRL